MGHQKSMDERPSARGWIFPLLLVSRNMREVQIVVLVEVGSS